MSDWGEATWTAPDVASEAFFARSLPTLDILICSVHARHDLLVSLLDHLAPQLTPYMGNVRVLLNRDDGQAPVGAKRNQLMLAATARHIVYIDDDDQVSPVYVERIMEALVNDPDYVGFRLNVTLNGYQAKPAIHSITNNGWSETDTAYLRDLSHINPIRRTYALQGLPFWPGFGEDKDWADRVKATGLVQTEVYIPEALYTYAYSSTGSLFAGGARHVGQGQPLPPYAHVADIRDGR